MGRVGIGSRHPVSLQSMTNTSTRDTESTLKQIRMLKEAGCQIIRVAVPDLDSVGSFKKIVSSSDLPVIADIHFDAALALKAIDAGAHGIRINPGNIGSKSKVREILHLANQRDIPIRIGVNYGSIEKKYRCHETHISRAEAMVHSVMDWLKFFEDQDFFNIKISVKSSNVNDTVTAYRLIDQECDYPLHLGITEAGTFFSGTVKSAIGIGALLLDGIGNTIRVSLTADPLEEIRVGREILKALGLRTEGVEVISCPTCSRSTVDLIPLVEEVERRLSLYKTSRKLTVAVMGCEVNGPGEAADADIGIAFSRHHGFLFQRGKLLEKLPPSQAIDRLLELVESGA